MVFRVPTGWSLTTHPRGNVNADVHLQFLSNSGQINGASVAEQRGCGWYVRQVRGNEKCRGIISPTYTGKNVKDTVGGIFIKRRLRAAPVVKQNRNSSVLDSRGN